MLAKTEDLLKRHATINAMIKEREKLDSYVKFHEEQEALLFDKDFSPTNDDRQKGKVKTPEQLEKILTKLNPNCRFEYVPLPLSSIYSKPQFKRLYVGGDYVSLYHNHEMPEYSIFNTKEEEVFDTSVKHISGKDINKDAGEMIVNEAGELEFKFDPSKPRPGFRLIKIPWNELYRGWRTVLIRFLKAGYCSLEALERAVGTSSRDSWGAHVGKGGKSPW